MPFVIVKHSIGHHPTVFTPLFLGASIYIPDAEDIHNPGNLALWMAKHSITVSHLTPGIPSAS